MSKKIEQSDAAKTYWQSTRSMTLWLLLTWFVVTFAAIFFARPLSNYTLLGWPISFFMAAQGSILIYVAIIAFYALRMRRLDQRYHETQSKQNNKNSNNDHAQ
jgi:putative solute:sodium symporter small subunit